MNKIFLISVFSILTLNVMAQEKIVQTTGRTQLGEFAPKFAELNDDVLFGEVWSRTNKLGLRDRSLVTVTSTSNRRRRTVLPVPRSPKSSHISVSTQVGRRPGQRSTSPKVYGRKILPVKMPKPLSSVR